MENATVLGWLERAWWRRQDLQRDWGWGGFGYLGRQQRERATGENNSNSSEPEIGESLRTGGTKGLGPGCRDPGQGPRRSWGSAIPLRKRPEPWCSSTFPGVPFSHSINMTKATCQARDTREGDNQDTVNMKTVSGTAFPSTSSNSFPLQA